MASFIKDTGIITLSRVTNSISLIIAGIFTARYLGTEGKGQLALAFGVGTILAQTLCIGFDLSAPYHLAGDKMAPGRVLGCWFFTWIMSTLVIYIVFYPVFILFLKDSVLKGVPMPLLLLGSIICPIYMGQLLVNSTLSGYKEFFKQGYHNISISIAHILSVTIALIVFRFGTVGYAVTSIVFGLASLFAGFFILYTVTGFKLIFKISDWFKMLQYGYKTSLSQILNIVDLRLDIFIINYFVNTSVVGIYTVAASLANLFWLLTNSVSVALFPRLASLNIEKSRKLTSLLCRNTLWLTIIACGLFLLVCRPIIIFVFGLHFADASWALVLLMPGIVGQVVSRICFTDCSAKGYPGKATIAAGVTASLTIVLDLLLIPRYGMYGAAVASSIAYCTSGLLGLYWQMKLSGNQLSELIIPRKEDLRYYINICIKLYHIFQTSRFSKRANDE